MNQNEIALQLTLEAMKKFITDNHVTHDEDVKTLAKRTYTLYNDIYNNLFTTND